MLAVLLSAVPFGRLPVAASLPAQWGTVAVGAIVVLVIVAILVRPRRPGDSNDRALLDTLPLMVYSVEPRPPYKPFYLSPAIESLGFTRKEFMARPDLWMTLIHPEDREEVFRLTQQAMLRDEPFEYEYRVVDRGGRVRWLHDRGTVQRDGKGAPVAWQGAMLEVTARRDAERELRENEEKFSDQLRQAQKMEAIGRLAGGIAHDFNNLLNVIGSYAALVSTATPGDSTAHADLDEIMKAVDRGAALTRQLLTFSRFRMPEVKRIDVDSTIRDAEQMVKRLLGPEIDLRVHLGSSGAFVTMDPGQLDQVLVNLIVNSADAMVNGRGRIDITTARENLDGTESVRVEVADNGAGMDAATAARAMDPFFTTKEIGRGTGLGLSATYGIVIQAGGTITIQSELGVGTSVVIHLPCAETAAVEGAPAPAEPFARPAALDMKTPLHGLRVLVVDDEDGVRKTLTRILERHGFVVVSAENGEAALRAWEEHDGAFALAISDIRMPGMNGTELLRALRERSPGLPAIAMSGYPEDNLQLPSAERAPVRFIDKPFGMDAVLACVRQSLANTTERPAAQ